MQESNIHVQFQGFHPTEFTRSFVDQMIDEIREQAPTGATVRAIFTREKKRMRAHLRVLSAAGDFFVKAEGSRLNEVSDQLSQRIRRQLKRWKSMRFVRKSLKKSGLT